MNDLEILFQKSILAMTGADLLCLLRQAICQENNGGARHNSDVKYPELPRFVTGIKGLARILGISVSTVNRMKAEGVFNKALYQNGKTVIFETQIALECLKINKERRN